MTEVGREKVAKNQENPPLSGAAQRLLSGIPTHSSRGPAPVHLWNPPYCGAIDMRIKADGSWHYNGSPIGRIAMVKLFSTILRKDSERFVLVTPVERVGITVDDAPFLAVEMAEEAGRLTIRTNVDDIVEISREHPIRFATAADGGLKPYIHVRGDLWALASRSLTHELLARAEVEMLEQQDLRGVLAPAEQPSGACSGAMFGLRSGDAFFAIAPAGDIEGLA